VTLHCGRYRGQHAGRALAGRKTVLKFVASTFVAGGLLAASVMAHAADRVVLRFGSPVPLSDIIKLGFNPWIDDIARDSDGILEIKTIYSVVDHAHAYDATINRIVDMSWVIMGPYAGQFPRSAVAALPFEGGSGYATSIALWHLYETGLIAPEFSKIKLLGLFSYPSSGFHTEVAVNSLSDLKGLKLGLTGRTLGELAAALGATPITMTPADWYASLQRGVIRGVLTAWPAIRAYKLDEVAHFHLDGPFGRAPAFVFMNSAAYAALPDKAKKAIDGESGVKLSAQLGTVVDRLEAEGRDYAKSHGQDVSALTPTQAAEWRQRAEPIISQWVHSTPDGDKILAAYRADYQTALESR